MLANLGLTEAQRKDGRNFKDGDMIQFNQNAPGFKRGSTWAVENAGQKDMRLKNAEGEIKTLPLSHSRKYDVFRQQSIALSKGDKIRITKNGFDADKKRLNNGDMLEVVSISKTGNIRLRKKDGGEYSLDRNYGHIAHAHVVTSYFSQGKTVDEVFIAQPAATFPATDAKQFYVSVSRARHRAHPPGFLAIDPMVQLCHQAEDLLNEEAKVFGEFLKTRTKPAA